MYEDIYEYFYFFRLDMELDLCLFTSYMIFRFLSFYPFPSGYGSWFVLSGGDGSGLVGGDVVYNILILKSPKTRENSIFHKEVSGQ